MDNIFCEPSEAYSTSKQLWTSKFAGDKNLDLIGGYGSYINESIMIAISKKSIEKKDAYTNEKFDYNNYHFKNEDLKFKRDEINER